MLFYVKRTNWSNFTSRSVKSTIILVLPLVLRLYFVPIKNYNINIVFFVQGVQQDLVEAWLGQLTSQPRATQLLPKDHSLHSNLEEAMSRYLKDVKRTTFKADKRCVGSTK